MEARVRQAEGDTAVVFGILALKARPSPSLARRRAWAKTGVVLGGIHIALVALVV